MKHPPIDPVDYDLYLVYEAPWNGLVVNSAAEGARAASKEGTRA